MNNSLTFNSDIKEILSQKIYLPIFALISFIVFLSIIFYAGIIAEAYLYVFIFISSLPFIFLTIRYPKFWIYTIALSNIIFFYSRGEEITTVEIVLALEYLGTLIIWLLWHILIKREKLIYNIADFFVLFFAFFILINSIIAILNDVEILYWGREAANLILVLLYFPIRKYFSEKKELIKLLFIYLIVVIITAFLHFWNYYQAISEANLVYAYELVRGMRINQTLFTSASIFGFIFALYQRKWLRSILLAIFTVIVIGGLITSFSRTFWVYLAFALVVSVFYLKRHQRIRLLIYTAFVSVIFLFSMFYLFQDKAEIVIKLIENRFMSTTKGTKDVSVQARFVEYDAVYREIEKYPLGGSGLAKKFTFYNFLEQRSTHTSFIHNGYLFIAMKLGIPLAIICFLPFLIYLIKSESLARNIDDEFYRLLALGSFLSILLLIISNLTAAQIIQRETTFVTIFSFAFTGIVYNKFVEKIRSKDDKY